MYDYIIIGAGIVGSAIARELSKYQVNVLVLEMAADVANGQTIANSAIVHSGHDPQENTLKARLCVRGNLLYEELARDLSFPLLHTGAFLIAKNSLEEEMLQVIKKRAENNGVPGIKELSNEEAFALEPNLALDITKVLSLPTTKVTYPWEVAFALMENALKNGVKLELNAKVTDISKVNDYYRVKFNDHDFVETKGIINAAGVHSDEILLMIDQDIPFKITPRKGEYLVLDKAVKGFIEHVLYPMPSDKGKGVLLVPQVHGNILVGPTSTFLNERDDLSNTKNDLADIKREAVRLANKIPFEKTIRTFAGIRATSTYHDFYIKESLQNNRVFHAGGIDSPGLTAAPAIAEYFVELINEKYPLIPKTDFDPYRVKREEFHQLPLEKQRELIKNNKKYGNIICKCEKITEAEIIEAINGPLGNDTIKGIKKRARAGSGLCQGGYCENAVLKIIAREKNKKLTEVDYYNPNTPILLLETKVKK